MDNKEEIKQNSISLTEKKNQPASTPDVPKNRTRKTEPPAVSNASKYAAQMRERIKSLTEQLQQKRRK